MPRTAFVLTDVPATMDQAVEAHKAHKAFKSHFGKTYRTAEEERRAIVLLGNAVRRVQRLNDESAATGSQVQYEVNHFSDMSPAEFKRTMLTYKSKNIRERIFKRHFKRTSAK